MKFDIVVANPMGNQAIDSEIYEKDSFGRFVEHGGTTTGKADWAWLQHTVTALKDKGRAAVVLDTGSVTRGSGSKNEDRERNIRRWFVAHDLIEGVILLPDNLFYNTTAAGIIIVLRQSKPKDRKGKIVLVNAGGEFRKGTPKNYLPDEAVKKIADAFLKATPVEGFVTVITNEEATKNDFNLSPSRYLTTTTNGTARPLAILAAELAKLDKEAEAINSVVSSILSKLSRNE
jgi:type I restriction enzyme M protein